MIMSLGVTNSGKSYTLFGGYDEHGQKIDGIIPMTLKQIFKDDTEIHISLFEIFDKTNIDLLESNKLELPAKRIAPLKGSYLRKSQNISEIKINSLDHGLNMIEKGISRRKTQSTSWNQVSSRSHAFIQLRLTNTSDSNKMESSILFVDMAGDEKVARDKNVLVDRAKEG